MRFFFSPPVFSLSLSSFPSLHFHFISRPEPSPLCLYNIKRPCSEPCGASKNIKPHTSYQKPDYSPLCKDRLTLSHWLFKLSVFRSGLIIESWCNLFPPGVSFPEHKWKKQKKNNREESVSALCYLSISAAVTLLGSCDKILMGLFFFLLSSCPLRSTLLFLLLKPSFWPDPAGLLIPIPSAGQRVQTPLWRGTVWLPVTGPDNPAHSPLPTDWEFRCEGGGWLKRSLNC